MHLAIEGVWGQAGKPLSLAGPASGSSRWFRVKLDKPAYELAMASGCFWPKAVFHNGNYRPSAVSDMFTFLRLSSALPQ